MGGVKTLDEWLIWQQNLHFKAIDLGLERIQKVYQRLFADGVNFKVISIAGTNGKGSTAAFIEGIYIQAKVKIGKFTSPHLLDYNERFSINGVVASDSQICTAFAQIEAVRDGVSLSYFEFSTLAALLIFSREKVQLAILEIGLGGRLDSVNVVNNNLSIITNIEIDHTDYLGSTREQIGREKSGVMRPHTPCICGDNNPPKSIQQAAQNIGAIMFFVNQPYIGEIGLAGEHQRQNAALALKVVQQLNHIFPISTQHISEGIKNTRLLGRFCRYIINHKIVILDVAHNPAAVRALAINLAEKKKNNTQTVAIFSALKDKNISLMIRQISALIDEWFLVPLTTDRAIDTQDLAQKFSTDDKVVICQSMAKAIYKALFHHPAGQVIVFGSFYTVASAMKELEKFH